MILLTTVALAQAAPQPAQTATFPSAQDTKAEFDSVCRKLVEGDDPFFGMASSQRLQQHLSEGPVDPLSEMLVRGRLSGELIRLGEHQLAIDSLERILEVLKDPTLDPEGTFLTRVYRQLGMAYLQLGEDQNCVDDHSPGSCILPISPEAVHRRPEAVRKAGDYYALALERNPDDVTSRWLLNLSRMITGDYPKAVPEALRLPQASADALIPSSRTEALKDQETRWSDASSLAGLTGTDLAGGAIADDFDGDGFIDLISSSWHPCQPMRAYKNLADGTFTDVTRLWGLDGQLGSLNFTHADYDNDGDLDLLILRGGWLGDAGRVRNSLLDNRLNGKEAAFVDVTSLAGLAYPAYPTQNAAWIDLEPDGDLDVFIGNEATGVSTNPLQLFGNEGNPFPSQLFRNNGNGTFTDIARQAGLDNRRFTKASSWGDYDNDGDPDLYLSNIGPNRLYRNNGDGTFSDVAEPLGVVEPANGSFTTWFFDFDNDGDEDLFVGSFSAAIDAVHASYLGLGTPIEGRPKLYRNDGGHFVDISAQVGLDQPLLIMGANFGDLDGDGFVDLYLGTGFPGFEAIMPNVYYRNDGGKRLENLTAKMGLGHLQKGHGVAFADFNNDGREDLFEQLGGAFPYDDYSNALFFNPGGASRWLTLKLQGETSNFFAVGARVRVRVKQGHQERSIYRTVGPGGSFGSSSYQLELGLGNSDSIEEVSVRWPGHTQWQSYSSFELDRAYLLNQGSSTPRLLERPVLSMPSPTSRNNQRADHHDH